MMQPANLGDGSHLPYRRRLDLSPIRCVLVEGQVSSGPVVVVHVPAEDSPQVSLVQDDHVVEALAPNAPDDALDVAVLPRRSGRRHEILDAERLDEVAVLQAIVACPVA